MAESRAPTEQAADWLTIWQSEMAAMAQDRELAEGLVRLVTRSAAAANRMLQMAVPAGAADAAPRRTGAASPAGAAPAMAASGGRDTTLEKLAERVAALERERAPATSHGPDGNVGQPGDRRA